MIEHTGPVFGIKPLDLGQGRNQALDRKIAVPHRNNGQNITQIAKFNLYFVILAQDIVDLDPRKPDIQRVDRKLRMIKIKNRVPVYQFLPEGIIPPDLVDLPPRVGSKPGNFGKNILPV
ncbi:hypothetical protein SDC9_169993 [bioreactor metagenome]|uniref:Uncharacterized protein n=1 Tax=bioreactor metagenome TaxID=1076179 RepID=A0A645G9C4_9ZZZZ